MHNLCLSSKKPIPNAKNVKTNINVNAKTNTERKKKQNNNVNECRRHCLGEKNTFQTLISNFKQNSSRVSCVENLVCVWLFRVYVSKFTGNVNIRL